MKTKKNKTTPADEKILKLSSEQSSFVGVAIAEAQEADSKSGRLLRSYLAQRNQLVQAADTAERDLSNRIASVARDMGIDPSSVILEPVEMVFLPRKSV